MNTENFDKRSNYHEVVSNLNHLLKQKEFIEKHYGKKIIVNDEDSNFYGYEFKIIGGYHYKDGRIEYMVDLKGTDFEVMDCDNDNFCFVFSDVCEFVKE